MKGEGEAGSTVGWGLRRYAWVVLAAMVVLGVSVPEALHGRQVPTYDAQAQVGPITKLELPNLDALPRTGESVFANGGVAEAVRKELGLSRTDPVIPNRVELVAPQDNVVFSVVGHASDPQDAANAANAAAGKFTEELNKYSAPMGTFAVQSGATPPTRAAPSVGWVPLVLAGLLAGLLVGVGVVGLILTWRRPVLSAAGAERATGSVVLGNLLLDSVQDEIRGLPRLRHALRDVPLRVVYLIGPPGGGADRHRLAAELRQLFAAPRAAGQPASSEPLVVADPSQLELAARSDDSLTLLLVRVGVPERSLRREAEQHLDPGRTGIVLLRRRRRLRGPFSRLVWVERWSAGGSRSSGS